MAMKHFSCAGLWRVLARATSLPGVTVTVGRFKSVVLRPTVTVTPGSDVARARTLHKPAHEMCFIANSVNFPVECEPEIVAAS